MNDTFEVETRITYRVNIIGDDHLMRYLLDLSYNTGQASDSETSTA